jgi:photosystem II stability/assembly factor-like uncharacterized protein
MRAPCLLLAALLAAASLPAEDVVVDADTFGGLSARSIGPAVMSGRITDLAAVRGDRLTLYAGAAGGGLWKSVDGGVTFKPVFDKHNQSIGAVAVDPSAPATVWVGTGESWVRNSVSVGDGVYRSKDGGDTWEKLGLQGTERIARIVVDPQDGNTVFVCATGHLFDDHPDRGVYRTRDGGKTWEKVLFAAPDAGCADLVQDPHDGRVLYAALWQFRRKPDFFTSGGPKSGLFKSSDGGSTWKPLRGGLPGGDLGRIALAASPVRAGRVWAAVESARTALFRSEDGGETWSEVNSSSAVTGRPFYFARLVADPVSAERVYKPGYVLTVSDDGGKTFSALGGPGIFGPSYHADVHALWIDPKDPDELAIGTDGGVYLSHDRGARWRFVGTLPVSQFYHVSVDMEWPFNVYGGLQDNSSWYGPSRRSGGIGAKHWNSLSPGDGFWTFPDPADSDIVYDEIQGGNLFRSRKSTGERKDIKPSPKKGEPRYRFNWNTPIHLSRTQPGTMYYGAQFLFRSRDRGDSWERVSPDLTTNDPAKQRQNDSGGLTPDNSTAENHCTIFAIAESPKNPSVIWVGTDDGNLQVTRDAGKTWTNVAPNVAGLPRGTWVSSVEPSRHDEAAAYATFDGHMTGDMKPHVFKTTDFGKSWTALASADMKGFAHVVREDLVNPALLFVGTEAGLWISVDGGRRWGHFTAGMPPAPVRDLAIHGRDHDLVIATHGRGLYVLDDLTPLRGLTPAILAAEAAFLESRPSPMVIPVFEFGFNGDGEFEGQSPGEAALIAYYLRKRHMFGDLRLEVLDGTGAVLSSVVGGKRRGINRVEWPMRARPPRIPAGEGIIPNLYTFVGPRVAAGTYDVRMVKGKDTYTSKVQLVNDPRSRHEEADRALQRETVRALFGHVERLAFLVDRIVGLRDQARARARELPEKDALGRKLIAFADGMEAQRKALVSTTRGEGISGEQKLREELALLYGNVNGYEGRPTESQVTRMGVLAGELEAAGGRYDAAVAREMPALNTALAGRKAAALAAVTEEDWRRK